MGIEISAPEKLTKHHGVGEFDCGRPALNEWLRRYAMQNQRADSARTFVVADENRVVGYYSLAVGAVDHSALWTKKSGGGKSAWKIVACN